jgi:choline dehydrogenase-like flavoprotein
MDEFDYLVVGGGSSGCVVAGRLSEDPRTSVAVLEAGGDGKGLTITTPAAGVFTVPTRLHNWAFETVPQPGLNGRRGYQPRGKALGGSSAINAMVYTRGHRQDYDGWASLGNKGWSYEEVLPYFKKAEHNEDFSSEWHGQGGPLNIASSRTDNPFQQIFMQAAREAGFPLCEDFNVPEPEGLGIYQVTQKNGERCSAARAYIHPHLGTRRNLVVERGAYAQRILFEGKRAVAVEFTRAGERRRLGARREIIVCAGAIQSPHILMLSGVGDGRTLQHQGIPVTAHLPGVGGNLQDHPDFIFGYSARSLDLLGLSAAGLVRLTKELRRYRAERRGMLTSNFAEAGGFLKTRPHLLAPDIQLHFVVAMVENHARTLRWGHGFSCHFCLLRPRSKGKIGLRSSDPLDPPAIDPNFLGDSEDTDDMVEGFKLTRRLMDAPTLASWRQRDLFTAGVRSDDEIRAALRRRVDTVYHPVGTCKMGVDEDAVVDPQLRVRGLTGLRVVDCSIMPTLIAGNTNAVAIMIGEKAVDAIRA